jgi:hypothetical protein
MWRAADKLLIETPLVTEGGKKHYFSTELLVGQDFHLPLCSPLPTCFTHSLTDLFVHLQQHGIAILVIPLTIPSTIIWP